MRTFQRWLELPAFKDNDSNRTATLLNQALLISTGMWFAITTVLLITRQFGTISNVLASYIFIVLFLILREVLRRGFVRTVAILMPVLLWIATVVLQFQIGDSFNSHVLGYVLACAIATLLVGPNSGFLLVVASTIAVFALNNGRLLGLLPPPVTLSIVNEPIIFVANMMVLFAFLAIVRENLFNALHKAEQELQQRHKVEEDLRQVNAHLDEIVNQRTRELQAETKHHRQTEAALHDSDAKFRVMMEFTQDWNFWMGPRQEIYYMTSSCKRITGHTSSSFMTDPDLMLRIVHPEDRAGFQQHTLTAIEQRRPCKGFDFRILTTGNEERWIGHICHPVFSAQGIYLGSCSSNRDITEQKRDELRHEQMEEILRQRNKLLSSLNHSTLEFLQYRDTRQLFQSLLDHATRLLDAPFGEIVTLEGDELVVFIFTANQPFLEGDRSKRGEAILTWQAVDTLMPAVLEDYEKWPHRRPVFNELEMHAVVEIPMISGDGRQCLGVIGLGRQERNRPFSTDEIETARLFAQIAGLALENIQLQNSLTEQTVRDPLTGLYNRRYLFETLPREVSRAIREKAPISLILLDIDHFKQINDRYGHGAGDAVLRTLAEQFKSMARASDILCRYGGDEHMIVMYNTPAQTALARAEQWRQVVENLPFYYNEQSINSTISLGIAVFPDHGDTIDEVIACADRALYQSKSGGRNQSSLFDHSWRISR